MSDSSLIQVQELSDDEPVVCPFCGFQACPSHDTEGWEFDRATCICEHSLFVVTDFGFEFRSSRFNQHMNLPDDQESEPPMPEDEDGDSDSYDAFTSKVRIPGSVKFEICSTHFGVSYGFAP